jgi:Cys-rich four helix bundle protein (predicted Tat secretion target)
MTITRRDVLLVGATALAAQAIGGTVAAADEAAPRMDTHRSALAEAADECIGAGNACLQHCLDLLAKGDTSLAECAQNVRQMLAICTAVGPVAVASSKYLKATARLCLEVCTDCEQACRKHESHHAECKRCAEACARSIAEAKKVLA